MSTAAIQTDYALGVAGLLDGQVAAAQRLDQQLTGFGTALDVADFTALSTKLLTEFVDEVGAASQILRLRVELSTAADSRWSISHYDSKMAELNGLVTGLRTGLDDGVGSAGTDQDRADHLDRLAGAFHIVDANGRVIPTIGRDNLDVPEGAVVTEFSIPVWEGSGVTRVQYFIDDEEVCLSGTGPDIFCGNGDDRTFVTGDEISDYNHPARVRLVLDHETGVATVISYPTHGKDGEKPSLPVDLTVDGPVGLPDEYPSQVRVWTEGEGIDDNVVFDYRFINGETPKFGAGAAPGINGAVRIQRNDDGTITVDGTLAQYPSVEIIRDEQLDNGYGSTVIFLKEQESGGPLNLHEPGEPFEATG